MVTKQVLHKLIEVKGKQKAYSIKEIEEQLQIVLNEYKSFVQLTEDLKHEAQKTFSLDELQRARDRQYDVYWNEYVYLLRLIESL